MNLQSTHYSGGLHTAYSVLNFKHYTLPFQGTTTQTDSISNPTPDMLLPSLCADMFRDRRHQNGKEDEPENSEDSITSFSNEESNLERCQEDESTEHCFSKLAEAPLENPKSLTAKDTLFYSNSEQDTGMFSTVSESEPLVTSTVSAGYKCCRGRYPCTVFHPEEKQKSQLFEDMESGVFLNEKNLQLTQTAASDNDCNGEVVIKCQEIHTHNTDNQMDIDSTAAASSSAKHDIKECISSTNVNYTCHKCGNTYMTDINLSFHVCNFMNSRCYVCNVCGKEFATIKTMRCHAAYHTGKYQCETCGNYFSAEAHRSVHMRKHTGEKPHICNICGKTFMYSNSLAYHLNIHRGENSFICDICGHRSFSKGNFERHKASHTKIKPHMCEICGKAFTVNVDLKRHRLTHNNDKNFICDICDKRFKTAAILTNHQRLHTGERPYSCDVCGKKFARNDGLKEHRLTHTGEKRHSCTRCGKQFTWSKGLRKHKCEPVSV